MTIGGPLTLGGEISEGLRCSRVRCAAAAVWAIQWRNPKIHSEERRKVWLACGEHRPTLEAFLSDRSFPLSVIPVGELDDRTR